jgi:hypothetical protein
MLMKLILLFYYCYYYYHTIIMLIKLILLVYYCYYYYYSTTTTTTTLYLQLQVFSKSKLIIQTPCLVTNTRQFIFFLHIRFVHVYLHLPHSLSHRQALTEVTGMGRTERPRPTPRYD